MFSIIKKIAPSLAPKIHIFIGRMYDFKKFAKHCSSVKPNISQAKLQAYITRQYHGIEKGLTLPDTRLGFGESLIIAITNNLNTYISKFEIDSLVSHAASTLKKYKELPKYTFYKKKGPQHSPIFKTDVQIPNSKKIIGVGTSKKSAQQNAANKLLKILKII